MLMSDLAGSEAPPVFERLKQKQRTIRAGFPEGLALRVHRALSWLGRAEAASEDPDLRFILLWVGFNAAYAADIERDCEDSERTAFQDYFATLVRLDGGGRIYDAVWRRFSQEIRLLLANRYVFQPFWRFQNGVPGYEGWEERMASAQRRINRAIAEQDAPMVLCILFDRLYVLRNQLVHGGATWNSSVNRSQVRDGAAVLATLLPVFIDLMMDNPHHDWGRPYYPVVG
jgi:hypothetical protein